MGMGACASICFAKQGHYAPGVALSAREHNLRLARGSKSRFARMAIADLHKLRARLVSVHDSGDYCLRLILMLGSRLPELSPEQSFTAIRRVFVLISPVSLITSL